jgi:RimJ/RimL family protein N-acetyltransferase
VGEISDQLPALGVPLDGAVVAICDDAGTRVGSLVPIGAWILERHDLIEAIAEWREKNSRMFFTQFASTAERTRAYLAGAIVAAPNRVLHLICDATDQAVGHIGLNNIDGGSAELDNLIRGRSGGHPRLIHFAERAFLAWAFATHSLRRIDVRYFSFNWMVRDLHEAMGFGDPVRTPLRKQEEPGLVRFEPCSAESANVDFATVRMQLTRDQFHDHLRLSIRKAPPPRTTP